MENNTEQKNCAEFISNNIKECFLDDFLVKPLDPIKVKKEFSKPIEKDKANDDGMDVVDYDSVEKEIKEVDSDYRKGVVLKMPLTFKDNDSIKVGDTLIFKEGSYRYYDLLKDSILVKYYNIIAVEAC